MGGHQIVASATDPGQNVSDAVSSGFSIVETGLARGGCSSGGPPTPALAAAALLWALRRRRRMAPAAAVLALAGAPAVVRAQNIDVSLFRPATGGDGLVAVEGARPPLPGEAKLELRTWTDYAVQPLSYVTSSGQQALVKNRAAQWLGAQVHLIGPLSLAAQMPITLSESGDLSSLPGSSQGPSQLQSGFGDLRLTPRLGLLRQEDSGIDLAFQMSFELPTAQAQSLTSDGGVRLEGLVALGRRLTAVPAGALDLLTNAYLRSRPERQLLDVKTGTEAGLRAGLGYAIDSAKRWIPSRVYAELEARTVLRAGFAGGTAPAEWRMGTTVCPAGNLAIDFAGGTALTDGIGAPKARFIFGIGWSAASCNRGFARAAPPPAPAPAVVVVAATPPAKPVAQALPLPPPDRDGDGIPDADDNCPDEPGLPENQGCPHGIRQRVVVSANSLEILDRVHFATSQSKIEPRSFWLLDQVAAVLKSHPDLLVLEVEGHTDDQGGSAYNILLSHARATAVADYLVSKGVDRARLVPHGFGPTRPVASNGMPEGRAANRRVAFTVVKTRARVIEAERPPNS
jgi:OOP family OmpA-OmpF porin